MSDNTKTCPFCGEEIMATAKKCKHCGEWLEKQEEKIETKECPICGESIPVNAITCKHCGEKIEGQNNINKNIISDELPSELKQYNWGAFLVAFIWGWFNGMPKNISVIAAVLWVASWIPVINILTSIGYFGLSIWAGTQGNQWAWNYKKWDSVESFNEYQQKWVVFPLAISVLIGVICGFVISMSAIV